MSDYRERDKADIERKARFMKCKLSLCVAISRTRGNPKEATIQAPSHRERGNCSVC